ncbi:toprim domain-containing protein [bacterium]|nr:toprim domain-containing protein [bacterium]
MNKQLVQNAKNIDLLSLVRQNTTLRKVASTNGGEYAGPCPNCGGKDRFRVQPNNPGGGIWFCRKCTGELWKDSIDFKRFIHPGMSFHDVVNSLINNSPAKDYIQKEHIETQQNQPIVFNPKWQERAQELSMFGKENLHSRGKNSSIRWQEKDINTGQIIFRDMTPLDYLFSRGLDIKTIQSWDLGYIPENIQDDPKRWGLSGKQIWIPQGILIPCIIELKTWYMKIRQPMVQPKYNQIRGSHPALYMIQTIKYFRNVIFCEGELDALLLWQQTRSLTGVVSLGSASNKINFQIWWQFLIKEKEKKFITAYDNDPAGHEGRKKLNISISQHIDIPKLTEYSKDITDYYCAGGDIRALVEKNLVDRTALNIYLNGRR